MRVQVVALFLVAVTLGAASAPNAWPQVRRKPAADPFGGPPPKTSGTRTNATPKVNAAPKADSARGSAAGKAADAVKPATPDRAARRKAIGLDPVRVGVVNESESAKRIMAVLGDETTNAFDETPLDEAIRTISQHHDIPIVVDRRALEEIGIASDTPVSLSLRKVTLRSFLRLLLRDLDLTYMVKDQVMQITTVEAAEQNLVTRMYALPEHLMKKSGEVLESMQAAIVPDTWSTQGGPSSASTIDHVLIISATSYVHDQVEDFLNTLVETYSASEAASGN